MRIKDIYGPNAREVHHFYIQPANSNCPPGTFDCDLGSHRGSLKGAIEQAASFYQYRSIRMKIVDEHGELQAYYPE